jgi:hypothetical protein
VELSAEEKWRRQNAPAEAAVSFLAAFACITLAWAIEQYSFGSSNLGANLAEGVVSGAGIVFFVLGIKRVLDYTSSK